MDKFKFMDRKMDGLTDAGKDNTPLVWKAKGKNQYPTQAYTVPFPQNYQCESISHHFDLMKASDFLVDGCIIPTVAKMSNSSTANDENSMKILFLPFQWMAKKIWTIDDCKTNADFKFGTASHWKIGNLYNDHILHAV